jgi:hypothetical protein
MSDKKPPTKFFVMGADALDLGVGPNREVVVKLIGLEEAAGMTPGLGVMMALTPTEARRFADALHRTADKAEAGLPRA